MSILRTIGWMFARLIALAVLLLSAWMLIINIVEVSYEGWILGWILFSGVLGTVGGTLYLLTIDGPKRYRTRVLRTAGWTGMLVAMVLPTSLSFFLLPLVALLIPTLVFKPGDASKETVTSS